MLTLCGLPHSSAAAGRQFTLLGNIKTKLRNGLLMQTTSCLMHVKQLIWRSGTLLESWIIHFEMRKKYSDWQIASKGRNKADSHAEHNFQDEFSLED